MHTYMHTYIYKENYESPYPQLNKKGNCNVFISHFTSKFILYNSDFSPSDKNVIATVYLQPQIRKSWDSMENANKKRK